MVYGIKKKKTTVLTKLEINSYICDALKKGLTLETSAF